jgi:zinc transport system substrate-binding protein
LCAAPRVVTSVAPLFEIAAELMEGIDRPQLIIDRQASAHHFALRPSHMRMLQQADLVIWIDRGFEAGFSRIDGNLPPSASGLELLPMLGDGDDGHFWYSPRLLQRSVDLIARALAEIDPDNSALYLANADALAQNIARWRERNSRRWQGREYRLLADHDFLEHFAHDLDGFEIVSIHDDHDARGSLGDLRRIEEWLRSGPVDCLVTPDPEPSTLAARLADKYALQVVRLLEPKAEQAPRGAVLRRLEQLEAAIDTCLAN